MQNTSLSLNEGVSLYIPTVAISNSSLYILIHYCKNFPVFNLDQSVISLSFVPLSANRRTMFSRTRHQKTLPWFQLAVTLRA